MMRLLRDAIKSQVETEVERHAVQSKISEILAGGSHTQVQQQPYDRAETLRELKDYKYCIILPDDPWKLKWDLFISVILLIVFFVTPYRIGFAGENDDSLMWIGIDQTIDFFFLLDILVTFLSAYYDRKYVLVDNRFKIAITYLTSWFVVDVIAIVPFNLIFGLKDYGSLVRFSKVSRLGKLLKMLRMVRLLKILKERNKLMSFVGEYLKISAGVERLTIFLIVFVLLCHIVTSLWVIIATFEDEPNSWIAANGY